MTSEALVVSWHGQSIRVRHDDPRLGEYTPGGAVIRNAVHIASDVRGLELALNATVGDRYAVRVVESADGVATDEYVLAGTETERDWAPGLRLRAAIPLCAVLGAKRGAPHRSPKSAQS
jgi:hypothetical protein